MVVAKLDRVFDAQDVDGPFVVGPIDDGRQSGRFAGTRWSRNQHDAVVQIDNCRELPREVQIFETWNFVGNHPHHDRVSSTLAENVDAEAANRWDGIGKVGGALLFQPLPGILERTNQIVGNLASVLRREAFQALEFQLH